MANSILITGGAASGKARFAVTNFAAFDYVLYLRVGENLDPDITHRIEYSTQKNFVEWTVVHKQTDTPADEVQDHKFVIFDSISAYTRLIMDKMYPGERDLSDEQKKEIEKSVLDGLNAMVEKVYENHGSIILITLETGFSVKPEDPALAAYRDILGRVNQRIANTSDKAYFSVSGIQFEIR